MELNTLNTIPLEIQYLIFESLSVRDIERTIKAVGICLDDLYWSRRHKRDFTAARREIAAITHSIRTETIIAHTFQTSIVVVGDYTTRYRSNLCLADQQSAGMVQMQITSNKTIKYLKFDSSDRYLKRYAYVTKYRGCKYKLEKIILTARYWNDKNHSLYLTISDDLYWGAVD
jgi:hypothetical protein